MNIRYNKYTVLTIFLLIILASSIITNIILYLITTHVFSSIGFGQTKASPDGSLVAVAMEKRELFNSEQIYYEFTIMNPIIVNNKRGNRSHPGTRIFIN
jgi:hypothetical protein